MTASDTPDLAAFEDAAVHAWPAFHTAEVDGWLWRSTGGGSHRANSVSTLRYTGADVTASVERVEALYRQRGQPAQFQISEVTAPPSLDALLAARGYRIDEPCTTLWKPVGQGEAMPADVEASAIATPDWLGVYLGAISASRQGLATRIVAGVPAPRALMTCRRAGRAISSGMGVLWGDVVVVQCMATLADARRQGGGAAVLAAIEAWAAAEGARRLMLGAVEANVPAQELYRRHGFALAGRYWSRVREG